ncbi:MAG: hypothetical protein AB7V14_06280 [Kiritimatiellia bacterium]
MKTILMGKEGAVKSTLARMINGGDSGVRENMDEGPLSRHPAARGVSRRAVNAFRAIIPISLMLGSTLFFGCEGESGDDAESTEVHPIRLEAKIGGIFGPSYEVVLAGSHSVVYGYNPSTFTSYSGTKRETIRVSEERWSLFRQALDEAKVWNWNSEYVDPEISDGTSWSLVAEYADESIDAHGRNAYPKQAEFDRFLQGVRELTGGKDFR